MIPGANVFNIAMSVIGKQTITYYQYLGREVNEIGIYVPIYNEGNIITGSFQPVPRSIYRTQGLDLQRRYFTLYSSTNFLDINRNVSSDQIVFNNRKFQCESNIDWYEIDGWTGVLCIELTENLV
jgi:hypothetical protein